MSDDPTRGEITRLLNDLEAGDPRALDRLFPLVYDELRRRAHWQLAASARSLATTELVHETYLKLLGSPGGLGGDRRHFFNIAGRAMRQLLVDFARERSAAKRGGGVRPLQLEESLVAIADQAEEILALNEALGRLESLDPRLARVVELRFFAGLSMAEIAALQGVTERTAKRDWRKARAFLFEQMSAEAAG